jgi:hypothetical protein
LSGFEPGSRSQRFDFRGLGFGQAFEEVLKIFRRIDAQAPTTAQHRVDHRAPLAGLGMPNEQKILLTDGGRTNGILTKVVVDLQPAILHIADQGFPAAEDIVSGLTEQALGQHPTTHHFQRPAQPRQDGSALPRSHRRPQLGAGRLFPQAFLHRIEQAHLAHQPRRRTTFAQRFVNAPPRVRPATNQNQLAATLPGQGFIHPVTISLEVAANIFEELPGTLPGPADVKGSVLEL